MPSKAKLLNRVKAAMSGRPTNKPPQSVTGSAAGQVDYLLTTKYGGSTKALAKDLGVSQRYVQQVRSGRRQPSKALAASLRKRSTATYADRSRREAAAEAKAWKAEGAAGFGEIRMTVDVAGSNIQIQGSPKIRGRSVILYLSADQAADLAAAKGPESVKAVAQAALVDYFNGVSPGHERPTYGPQFSPDDIEFDLSGVDFD